jgi:hypothetical protein
MAKKEIPYYMVGDIQDSLNGVLTNTKHQKMPIFVIAALLNFSTMIQKADSKTISELTPLQEDEVRGCAKEILAWLKVRRDYFQLRKRLDKKQPPSKNL